jgi:hypothetical protein
MQVDPKTKAAVAPKMEAARAAFFELWLAMNVAVRAHGVSSGEMSLGHVLTREEQAAVLAYCVQCVQGAETVQQAAERTKRLRASFGHPAEEEAAPPGGKRSIIID